MRDALGPQASKVTTAQIQEALWHYFYDVDKSVAYLVTKHIASPAPKAAKSAPAQKNKGEGESKTRFLFINALRYTWPGEVVIGADPYKCMRV